MHDQFSLHSQLRFEGDNFHQSRYQGHRWPKTQEYRGPEAGSKTNPANGGEAVATSTEGGTFSRIEVKLTGQPIQYPAPVFKPGERTSRLELEFVIPKGGRGFKPGREENYGGTAAGESVVVWCSDTQYARVAPRLNPRTRLVVKGIPEVVSGRTGQPQLVIECFELSVEAGWATRFRSNKSGRLAICWVLILGVILILNTLLSRLTPPGLLPLAVLLGSARLVENLEFIPETVRGVIRRYQVKLLFLAAVLLAIWFFVQYSYYTTPGLHR